MTPAERQRLCRERGKGRHRGYRPTRADMERYRAKLAAAEQATPAPELPVPTPPPAVDETNSTAAA